MEPDYAGAVVPPNLAPLNFAVNEPGRSYVAKLSGDRGEPVVVASGDGLIRFPKKRWAALLEANRGGSLHVDVFVQGEDTSWRQFERITNTVAAEPIDRYLVYRLMWSRFNTCGRLRILQRDLSCFDETLVLDNVGFGSGCINCHTFRKNDSSDMLLHTRGGSAGSSTILVRDGRPAKVNTVTDYGLTGYASWHPSGRMIVCAVVKVRPFLHPAGNTVMDVIDVDSTLVCYLAEEDRVETYPGLSRKDRMETYPCWSPDGRYLYFSSAEKLWDDNAEFPPKRFDEVRYDLVRVSYDAETQAFGEPETVLASAATGMSMTQPKISPDGRWLLFSGSPYGCFPVCHADSDLYLLDLVSGKYDRVAANSDKSDSWHSWSSNGRWVVFSSKRDNGIYARPYISYVDAEGTFHKPLLLPQSDPRHYESFVRTYNVPELVATPVPVDADRLSQLVATPMETQSRLPITSASPNAGRTMKQNGGGKP
ncbi:MAG: PD40 domain-containing protein [Planctomycetes bacterium]|nr:PD40 domain-containing protein [Planctomycetota bacterium]